MNQIFRFSLSILAIIFLGIAFLVGTHSAHAVVIYENDFEDDAVGTYTVSNLSADWNGTTSNDGVDEGRVSITDDEDAYGDKSLVVMYPDGLSNTGKSQWKMDLGGSYDELYLSYRVRFDENFDFVRGGKLPGLCGGACNSGGSMPNGVDGWSGRMMWRTSPSGGSTLPSNRANIVQYLYHPDQTANGGVNGDDLRWDDTTPTDWKIFDSDVWYHLQHRIVMNTPGQFDGIVQAWLDGEMVLDVQNIRFRDWSGLKIDTLYFSTFFGGSSSVWETTKDEFAYFDDFIVSTEFIGVPTIPEDLNQDGFVDSLDLGVLLGNWGINGTPAQGELDGNPPIDSLDLGILLGAWNPPPSAATSIPEPCATLVALSGLSLLLTSRHAFSH